MAVNKVVYSGKTLIDLTSDTVTTDTLAKGVTAHDAGGNKITGTMQATKPTQFTNLYDPANVTVKTRFEASSSAGVAYTADNYCNYIVIPFHHIKNEPVVMRMRGIGTVRDRYNSATFAANGTTKVNHYSFHNGSTTQFEMSYDEHGDIMITFKGVLLSVEWYYFVFNFQYVGVNSNATAKTGPIITINEPIGNGGHV